MATLHDVEQEMHLKEPSLSFGAGMELEGRAVGLLLHLIHRVGSTQALIGGRLPCVVLRLGRPRAKSSPERFSKLGTGLHRFKG